MRFLLTQWTHRGSCEWQTSLLSFSWKHPRGPWCFQTLCSHVIDGSADGVSFHWQRSSGGPLVLNIKRLVTFPRFLPSHVRHTWKVTGIWCMCLVMFAVHTNITRVLTVCKSHLPDVRQRSGSSKNPLLCKMWQIFFSTTFCTLSFFPNKMNIQTVYICWWQSVFFFKRLDTVALKV